MVFHPVFLLLPVDREDYVGMLVTVWTPYTSFQGSYLLRTNGFPTVQRLFDVMVQGNQCVWANTCQVSVGDQIYEWGMLVPVYAGINIELRETAPVLASSQSTCTDPEGHSSDEDSEWQGSDSPTNTSHAGPQTEDPHQDSLRGYGIALLQMSAQVWRPNFATVAQAYLPPPGNGPRQDRRVCL